MSNSKIDPFKDGQKNQRRKVWPDGSVVEFRGIQYVQRETNGRTWHAVEGHLVDEDTGELIKQRIPLFGSVYESFRRVAALVGGIEDRSVMLLRVSEKCRKCSQWLGTWIALEAVDE